jgi:membrane fusion protein (multidrug efflux system)
VLTFRWLESINGQADGFVSFMIFRGNFNLFLPVSLLGLGLLVGCGPAEDTGSSGGPMMPTQVVAVAAKTEAVADTLSLIGTVAADEMVELKSETAGLVESIHFTEGQHMEKDQLLIELDQSKLQSAVVEAEANQALSQSNFNRNRELLDGNLISKQEFDQSKTRFEADTALVDLRKRQLKDTRITAPFSGTVGSREVSPGQVISQNTTLTWLVSLDPVKLEFNVPERFLSVCKTGQTIDVKVAAYPQNKFEGTVYFVAPFVEPQLRTTLIKATVANPEELLKPGMFATLDLTLTIRDKAIVIPEPATFRTLDDKRAMIYVVDAENQAQLRTVLVGERKSKKVEILEGLAEGEMVIVEGSQKIGPGSPVKFAPAEAADIYQ